MHFIPDSKENHPNFGFSSTAGQVVLSHAVSHSLFIGGLMQLRISIVNNEIAPSAYQQRDCNLYLTPQQHVYAMTATNL